MLKILVLVFPILSLIGLSQAAGQAIPLQMNYQGQVSVNGIPFDGEGQFKFSLVDDPVTPTTNYWTNDGSTPSVGGEPTDSVSKPVSGGKYSIQLGDTGITNMTAIPVTAFNQPGVYLRIWFNDGSTGFQLLSPDRRLTSTPYAYRAEEASTVPNEAIHPEHAGRANTIVSYSGGDSPGAAGGTTIGIVPSDRSFVVTDIVINSTQNGALPTAIGFGSFKVSYDLGPTTVLLQGHHNKSYLSGTNNQPLVYNFQAGLPIPPNGTIRVENSSGEPYAGLWFVVSGYETTVSNVVAHFTTISGAGDVLVTTLPAGRNYILTDIVAQGLSTGAPRGDYINIYYVIDSVPKIVYQGTWQLYLPIRISLRSGTLIPEGAELRVSQGAGEMAYTLSGYEIPVTP